MSKKIIALFLVVMMVFALALTTACKKSEDKKEEGGTVDTPDTPDTPDTTACTEHTFGEGVVTSQATCKIEGVKTFTCTVCGETKQESIAKPADHSWGAGVVNGNITTYTCALCGETRSEATTTPGGTTCTEHTWGEAVTTKVATCVERGEVKLTCTECGFSITTPTSLSTEHNWTTIGGLTVCGVSGCGTVKNSATPSNIN